MKNIVKQAFLIAATGLTLFATSCSKDDANSTPFRKPAVFDYVPKTAEAAGVAPGTEITLTGISLDNVARVTVGAFEAKINRQEVKTLVFTVPTGDFPQDAHTLGVLSVYSSADDKTPVYQKDFFVYVSLTDAIISTHTPNTATVGEQIALTGHNLTKVNSMNIGEVPIEKAAFTLHTDTEIKFTVPEASYPTGESVQVLKAIWGDKNTEIVVNSNFKIITPSIETPPAQGQAAKIGEELTFTGTHLDLIEYVTIGSVKISSFMEQTATLLKFKIPNVDYTATTQTMAASNVKAFDIVGYWGEPIQKSTLFKDFSLDTTPTEIPVVAPTFTTVVPEDGGAQNDKFYLSKEVTVSGTGLDVIDIIKVDGVEATIKSKTGSTLVFVMPTNVAFTVATKCDFKASYDKGSIDITIPTPPTQLVYPFYYWKDVKIGAQGATENPFFFPSEGKTYSADEWYNTPLDPLAKSTAGDNAFTGKTMSGANTLNKTNVSSVAYYAVEPYFFFTNGSDMAIQSTSNSLGQLRNFKMTGGNSIIGNSDPALYATGTPVIQYRVMYDGTSSSNDQKYYDSVKMGTIATLEDYVGTVAGSGAPKFIPGTLGTSAFGIGCVILMQHFTYLGGTKGPITTVNKSGFIHIKDMTDIVSGKGSNTTVMTVDCYWPAKARDVEK